MPLESLIFYVGSYLYAQEPLGGKSILVRTGRGVCCAYERFANGDSVSGWAQRWGLGQWRRILSRERL